jgi:hypothetical protein
LFPPSCHPTGRRGPQDEWKGIREGKGEGREDRKTHGKGEGKKKREINKYAIIKVFTELHYVPKFGLCRY